MEQNSVYRKGVAAFILNDCGKILACSRGKYDISDWQIPQGGIEKQESYEAACLREVQEETGLTSLSIISMASRLIKYDWPPETLRNDTPYIGQEHFYFLIKCLVPSELKSTRSFKFYKWVSFEFLINEVIFFKRKPYFQAWEELKKHL